MPNGDAQSSRGRNTGETGICKRCKRSVGRRGCGVAESGQEGDRSAAGVVAQHVGEVFEEASALEATGGVR